MKGKTRKFATQILIASISASALMYSLASKADTYKVRFSGGGNAWWTGAANKYAIINVNENNKVIIKQTTLVSNMITGFGKWWEHPVTASRACPLNSDGWDTPQNCILGLGNEIQIPLGKSIKEYSYQFKWEEDGATQNITIDLRNATPEKSN
jgi:hypothetical protein